MFVLNIIFLFYLHLSSSYFFLHFIHYFILCFSRPNKEIYIEQWRILLVVLIFPLENISVHSFVDDVTLFCLYSQVAVHNSILLNDEVSLKTASCKLIVIFLQLKRIISLVYNQVLLIVNQYSYAPWTFILSNEMCRCSLGSHYVAY